MRLKWSMSSSAKLSGCCARTARSKACARRSSRLRRFGRPVSASSRAWRSKASDLSCNWCSRRVFSSSATSRRAVCSRRSRVRCVDDAFQFDRALRASVRVRQRIEREHQQRRAPPRTRGGTTRCCQNCGRISMSSAVLSGFQPCPSPGAEDVDEEPILARAEVGVLRDALVAAFDPALVHAFEPIAGNAAGAASGN